MSHAGFGGGHSGHGGHSGYGADMGHHHPPNHHISHGLGFLGGHGSVLGHVLHALGLNFGHHGHQGVHAGGHPDQSPLWNQAMQSEKLRKSPFNMFNSKPFLIVFTIFFCAFAWLYLIHKLHSAESERSKSQSLSVSQQSEPSSTATPTVSPDSYAQSQSAAVQNYTWQYIHSAAGARTNPAINAMQPYSYATTYSANFGYNSQPTVQSRYVLSAQPNPRPMAAYPAANPQNAGMPGSTYGSYNAAGSLNAFGSPTSQFSPNASSLGAALTSGPAHYATAPNGRQRLLVSR